MEDNKKESVAVSSFLKKLKHDWLRYVIVFVVALIGSILVILPVPRYYKCDISLAPEMDNTENGGKLSSIASSFGVDLGDVASGNALQPSLYPDLMKSNEFIKSLLQIPVETKDGSVKASYYDYLYSHQKDSPYGKAIGWIAKKFGDSDSLATATEPVNPFMLNKKQDEIFSKIKGNIACDIDNDFSGRSRPID